jgi:phage tail protein X
MTNNVLAELGFAGLEPVTTNSQAQRQSTSDILAGIEAATGQRSILDERETLEAIVITALRAGESDESIDLIVNTAAASGDVAVPEILVTSDGRVDTFVLLNNIVTQARIAAGGAAPAIPDVTPDNTAGMEVRIIQRATDEIEARFYTVQSGDSLGAISIKFYGVIGQYETIFEANKGLLSSPDRIRVGQRLVIPQLDA